MGGIRGDVIEIGFIQTAIMEMGQPPPVQSDDPAMWGRARQYTGRIVTITNDKIFETPVYKRRANSQRSSMRSASRGRLSWNGGTLILKTPANPQGLPIEAFDALRAQVQADRSQCFKDLSMPFYGYNRPNAKVSEGVRASFWLQRMLAGFPAAHACIKAFSETDFTDDLKKFDIPTLVLHGDDPDRARRRGRVALRQNREGCHAEGYSGRPARDVHHSERSNQCGTTRFL